MRKLVSQPLVAVIITFLIGCVCFSLYLSIFQLRGSAAKVAALKADVQKQQEATDALSERLHNAQSSYSKEEIIRDQLLMQKPGEFVVQIPDLPSPPTAEGT